jgi:hypothetical protein
VRNFSRFEKPKSPFLYLNETSRNMEGGYIGFIWLRIETNECGNKLLGSIKCWEILEWLSNC